MGALLSSPGVLIPVAGVLCSGLACAHGLARAAQLPAWWVATATLPLGVAAYAVLALVGFRLGGPGAGVIVASLLALAGLLLVVRRGRRSSGAVELNSTYDGGSGVLLATALIATSAVVGVAGARFALAVISDARVAPLLGEPSTGDWGLHVLRVAMIARFGVPPPSPLDPDFPLQYRYLFHALAAAFSLSIGGGAAAASAAVTGLVLAGVVLAGGALAFVLVQSKPAVLASGLLAALYGPSYWLPLVLELMSRGVLPTPDALASHMPEPWALSPLTPAFPSILAAQGSSPTLPLAALCWHAALLCGGCILRAATRRRALCSAGAAGAAVGVLAFAGDFFVPVAALSLVASLSMARSISASRRVVLASSSAAGIALLAALMLCAGQFGLAGAARDVRVALSSSLGSTPVYGGNHALLAGGTSVPLPNWIHIHDWGLVFWPGLVGLLVLAARWRHPLVAAGALTSLGCAFIWHALEITYVAGTPTDTRVQMYRYASLATASLAPLLPIAVTGLSRSLPRLATAACQAALVILAGGGGLYWVAEAWSAAAHTPPAWQGDVALAKRLAAEPGDRRLAILNAPTSFLGMYAPGAGGNAPLWWAFGETAMPVGWDFGHPERYEPLYRRVAVDLDPVAVSELGVTHLVVAPAAFPTGRVHALERLLRDCGAHLVASFGAPGDASARVLYRLDRKTCTPSGVPA